MAGIGNPVNISFGDQDRRRIDRLTKAIERLAKVKEHPPVVNASNVGTPRKADVYRDAGTGEYVTKSWAESHPGTTVKETVNVSDAIPEKPPVDLKLEDRPLEEAVSIAMGYASSCWTNLDGAGAFESERCSDAAEQLIARVKKGNIYE